MKGVVECSHLVERWFPSAPSSNCGRIRRISSHKQVSSTWPRVGQVERMARDRRIEKETVIDGRLWCAVCTPARKLRAPGTSCARSLVFYFVLSCFEDNHWARARALALKATLLTGNSPVQSSPAISYLLLNWPSSSRSRRGFFVGAGQIVCAALLCAEFLWSAAAESVFETATSWELATLATSSFAILYLSLFKTRSQPEDKVLL